MEWELNQSCLAIRVWAMPVDKRYLHRLLLSPSCGQEDFLSLVSEIPCCPVCCVMQDTSVVNLLEGENNGGTENTHKRLYMEGCNDSILDDLF